MKKTPIAKQSILKNNLLTSRLVVLIGVLLLLTGSCYLFRGWLRVTVVPGSVMMLHGQTLQRDMDSEMAALGDPLKLLGYSQIDTSKATCIMQSAQGFKETLSCTSSLHAYGETPKDVAGKTALNNNAQKLQTLLQQRGWEGEYTDTAQVMSLKRLVNNLNQGIDYTPDAAYMKTIGSMQCILDTSTAFSSPRPVAMATQISCSRMFMPFGHMNQPTTYLP